MSNLSDIASKAPRAIVPYIDLNSVFRPEVLYFDNHLIAISKPSGMVTHEDGVHTDTLRAFAENWLIAQMQKPGRAFIVPVHRLDKLTSGIVLFAKTDKALTRLAKAFREREVKKYYRLVTDDKSQRLLNKRADSNQQSEQWDDYLARDESFSKVVQADQPGAQLASLIASRLESFDGLSQWQVELLTGRHHQIRVQFASRGMPILGDVRYGGSPRKVDNQPYEGICLHHERLELLHPVLKTPLCFKAEPPLDWPKLGSNSACKMFNTYE